MVGRGGVSGVDIPRTRLKSYLIHDSMINDLLHYLLTRRGTRFWETELEGVTGSEGK